MSNELLQKVKDEYAKKLGFKDYNNFSDLIIEGIQTNCMLLVSKQIDEFCIRYAAAVTAELKSENDQLKSDIAELRTVIRMIYGGVDTTDYLENKMALILEKTKHYES